MPELILLPDSRVYNTLTVFSAEGQDSALIKRFLGYEIKSHLMVRLQF